MEDLQNVLQFDSILSKTTGKRQQENRSNKPFAGCRLFALSFIAFLVVSASAHFSPLSAGTLTIAWDANTESDLAGYRVYYSLASQTYTKVNSKDVGTDLRCVVDNLEEGKTYYFVVTAYDRAGNESNYSIEVSATVNVVDQTPPAITQVRAVDRTTVSIQFSEPVTKTTAENKSNYSIDKQIAVVSAALQSDNRTVILTTSEHINGTYTLSVQNISDAATPANIINPAISVQYTLSGLDLTPPALTQVRAIDRTTVSVEFSEPVAKTTAENKSNYSISQQIVIARATLQSDNRTVILETSEHNNGAYTLTVQNISDVATPANVINPAISAPYTFSGLDQAPPIVTYAGIVDQATVEVRFDEPISEASALKVENYAITNGITITSISLHTDSRGVHLKTSNHQDGASYQLTVRNIADQAETPNVMAAPAVLGYTYRANDRLAPKVVAVKLLDLTTLSVTFDERVTKSSAEQISNYAISENVLVQTAKLNAEAIEVILTTSAHAYDRDYTITISGITDVSTNANAMSSTEARYRLDSQGVDREPPVVTYVGANDETTVEVRFNEPVTQASAENLANYSINKGLGITGATLHFDGRGVHLKTTPQTDGVTYQVTVFGIADRAPEPNTMTTTSTLSYTFIANDLDAPAPIAAILAADLLAITLMFDEQVTAASAENTNNYVISDNIQVYSARLSEEGNEVTLSTSLHWYEYDFTITIRGLVDVSANANAMPRAVVLSYRANAPGQGTNNGLTISAWSRKEYQIDTLRLGKKLYIDRVHSLLSAPQKFEGMLMFRTAYRDRRDKSDTFFEFNLNREADVYVAYDNRGEPAPNWLTNNFTRVNKVLLIDGVTNQMQIWKARYYPGRVQLGGNMAAGARQDVPLTMYFVFVDDLRSDRPGANGIPKLFSLYQNYPNPFSLNSGHQQTEISYLLRQESHVVLMVYNMLGQAVRTLHDGVLAPGTHRHVWNGLNNDQEVLPSGKYLYVLEIREQVSNGTFTVTTALERQTKVMTLLK